jgi:hypothetical protein
LIAPDMGAVLQSTLINKRQEQQWIKVAPAYFPPQQSSGRFAGDAR